VTDGDGRTEEKKLKAKFLPEPLKHDAAVAACKALNADLWQVLAGKSEWDAVMKVAKEKNKRELWLDGRPAPPYPGANHTLQVLGSDELHLVELHLTPPEGLGAHGRC
jgi:hypothetical protein